jgi:hypothetical protein
MLTSDFWFLTLFEIWIFGIYLEIGFCEIWCLQLLVSGLWPHYCGLFEHCPWYLRKQSQDAALLVD